MPTKANLVFLGCNYSNKKVKSHFDQLKAEWESVFPIRVIMIDKEKRKGARDLWEEIKTAIENSALAIFDVSAFKPNVVLELGYALAVKDVEEVLVSFDERKIGKKKPEWALSDISHLNQIRYKELPALDKKLEENLDKVIATKRWRSLVNETKKAAGSAKKYQEVCLAILHHLRDQGPSSEKDLLQIGSGTAVRGEKVFRLLRDHSLAKRTKGRVANWTLVEDK